jgi:uroporphyrinogen-III decarboxylase
VKGEIFQPVLRDWSDLDKLQVPDYSHPDCASEMREQFTRFPDQFKIAGLGGWIFDNARYLRNMDVYFMDMALVPDQLKRLHEKIANVYEQKILLAAQAGADAIFIAEDLGTQTGLLFSPKMFRSYFLEMYAHLFSVAHQYGMQVIMHSCGLNRAILPDLLDAGVNVFQFDQPMLYDMTDLAKLLKQRKAALYSPIDIQQVLPTGDREKIETAAQDLIDCFQGGLICKNYLDLNGIGVKEEWDDWGYHAICKKIGFQQG